MERNLILHRAKWEDPIDVAKNFLARVLSPPLKFPKDQKSLDHRFTPTHPSPPHITHPNMAKASKSAPPAAAAKANADKKVEKKSAKEGKKAAVAAPEPVKVGPHRALREVLGVFPLTLASGEQEEVQEGRQGAYARALELRRGVRLRRGGVFRR